MEGVGLFMSNFFSAYKKGQNHTQSSNTGNTDDCKRERKLLTQIEEILSNILEQETVSKKELEKLYLKVIDRSLL